MVLLLFKLVVTPLLIALTTLASRRWGSVVGGWIVGLPLTSGPVSIFLALEQGRDFAATAAVGTLLGVLAVVAYCIAYARAARRFPWFVALPLALCSFFLAVGGLSFVRLGVLPAAAAVSALIALALAVEQAPEGEAPAMVPPRWDIPFRMAMATAVVLCVTALSTHLGPRLSGLLSVFPVFLSVMFLFAHKLCGPDSARRFARGTIMGSFSFVGFFLPVGLGAQSLNLFLVYLLASFAAIGLNVAVMAFFVRRRRC
jgi:hypothetical protein